MTGHNEHCKICKGHASQVGQLSRRGKCTACAMARVLGSVAAMVAESGDDYDRWVERQGAAGRPHGHHTPWRKGRRTPS